MPQIIDLKFTQTENDLYRTELEPNIFLLKSFFFSRKAYWTKNQLTRSWPELKPTWPETETEPESNHFGPKWPDPKLTRSELESNDPFVRSTHIT